MFQSVLLLGAIFVSLLSGYSVTWRCEVLRVSVGGSFLKIGTTMEVRWGWRAVWIGVVAVSFFLSTVGGSESPALKAGQTPASAFEAVKVCRVLLMLERFVCVGSDVVTRPRGFVRTEIYLSFCEICVILCKAFGFDYSCMMCEYVGLTCCHLPKCWG